MFKLDRIHVAQAKREYKRQTAASDAEEVRQAFNKSKSNHLRATFYSIKIIAVIKRIVHSYRHAATANIATGTVTEEWTRIKKTKALEIVNVAEKLLDDQLTTGEHFSSQLILDLDQYQKDYLANARQEYFDKTKWMPQEGNLEKIYIPMILDCMDIVHRIYCLYQIENMNNSDLLSADPQMQEKILMAKEMAEDRIQSLTEPLKPETLKLAKQFLEKIEKENERLSVMSAAGESSSSEQSSALKINLTHLFSVNAAFATELHNREALCEDAALRNIGTVTKRGVAMAVGAVGTATSLMGTGASYLSEKAMDYFGGPLEEENSRLRRLRKEAGYSSDEDDGYEGDTDDEEGVVTHLEESPQHQTENLIRWEYEAEGTATTKMYSPSTSTASAPPAPSAESVTSRPPTPVLS